MRILIVTHVIFPFQSPRSFRSTELAKQFAKLGHDVTIYNNSGDYDYTAFEFQHNVKIKNFHKFSLIKKDSAGNENYSLFEKILIKLFRRLIFYPNIEFLFNIKKSLCKEKDFDLLLSIAAPHSIHWGCERALRDNPRLAKRWIADCGDPFMGNTFEDPPFYFKFLEKRFCEKANFITVPVEEAKKAYYFEYLNKIKVIPQGFNMENIKLSKKEIKHNVPTFAFSGMVYKSQRDPTIFLDFLKTLDLDFKFIVYTKDVMLFPPYKKSLKNKLELRDYIPRYKLLFELSKMDFLINFENNSSVQSPSKLIDYAITKRPILSVNSDVLDREKVFQFMDGNYSKKKIVELENYNIETVAQQFINLVE